MRNIAVILSLLVLLDTGAGTAPKKYVALTFDDGPTGRYTAQLLDMLEEKGVRATFFVCGYRVAQYPALTAQIAEGGHEIGLHGFSHAYFSKLSGKELDDELTRSCHLIAEASGTAPTLVRPPGGLMPEKDGGVFSEYSVILWSVDPEDWATHSAERTVRRVLKCVQPGDIILLHDASESSVEAAGEIIDALQAQGYTFLTVSQLAAAYGTVPQAGCVYHRFSEQLSKDTSSVAAYAVPPVSLRLGHRAALTVHRTVIHFRTVASLPQGES